MSDPIASIAQREAFLAQPRLAILITQARDSTQASAPVGVPVWFEWDGTRVNLFTGKGTAKLKRIEQNPQVSILVTNAVGEDEAWVNFTGPIEVHDDVDAWPLVKRLAERYWDIEAKAQTMQEWHAARDHMVALSMLPQRISVGS